MIDHAPMTLLWKAVSSGSMSSEAMEKWTEAEAQRAQEREAAMDALSRGKSPDGAEDGDSKLLQKALKKLESNG
jgi:hypothetical protein